ncbi:MAG: polyphosphate kinase 2 family protein [Phycisphaerae bacterium]|nr:polyphosphate kinase 2 family protein [Phycisphaerae bacterium]
MLMRDQLRAPKPLSLTAIDPRDTLGLAKDEAVLERSRRRLAELHQLLWAENARAVLVVLQGIDTSGKDGTIRHVMTGLNPQGCTVTPFRPPSEHEADHDFLWRAHAAVPGKGEIGIFNRSHYEDLVVPRLAGTLDDGAFDRRARQINDFERLLVESGTAVLKVFLHISKEEQRERLQERLDDPTKNWKFSPGDLEVRRRWDEYWRAFERAIDRTNTDAAPWLIVPADRKWARNLAVSRVLEETLEGMGMAWPPPRFDPRAYKVE